MIKSSELLSYLKMLKFFEYLDILFLRTFMTVFPNFNAYKFNFANKLRAPLVSFAPLADLPWQGNFAFIETECKQTSSTSECKPRLTAAGCKKILTLVTGLMSYKFLDDLFKP